MIIQPRSGARHRVARSPDHGAEAVGQALLIAAVAAGALAAGQLSQVVVNGFQTLIDALS